MNEQTSCNVTDLNVSFTVEWYIWSDLPLEQEEVRLSLTDHITQSQVAHLIDSKASGLQRFVADRFFEIANVTAVAFQYDEGVLHVWTIVELWDEAAAKHIYALELQIMDQFSGMLFDFYMIPKNKRPIESLLNKVSAHILYREDGSS